MSTNGISRTIVLAIFTTLSFIPSFSQDGNKPADDVHSKPLVVGTEMKDAHKRWINTDAKYIATEAERKAFFALKTDEERENFIDVFWRRRDPNPDTEENEFREEYYERIAYANENFSSGVAGWLTDRGRIYIRWGKPDSIESYPSGGAYNRPSYEGGGSTTTYPFEVWFYRHLDNVGDGIEIEFVDPTGTGEYRIARDADEKDALAKVPVVGRKEFERTSHTREQDSPFRRREIEVGLSRPPAVKFGDLQDIASGDAGITDHNPLDFDLRIDFFRQSDDRVITTFTVQTDNRDLKFEANGGLETATLNIFGRITSVSEKRMGIFEDSVTTNSTSKDLIAQKENKSIYQKTIALAPGTYKVNVVVRDVGTGNRGRVDQGFTVPRYDSKRLSSSTLILASKLRSTTDRDIGQMFVIGGAKVVPNVSGTFKMGEPVGVYLQVYNAETDQTTLRPAVDVDYVLIKDGKEIAKLKEDWGDLSDASQRLVLAKMFPTDHLAAGDYEVRVTVRDRVGSQNIQTASKFTIIKN